MPHFMEFKRPYWFRTI